MDSRDAWLILNERMDTLRSVVRSPLLLSFLSAAMLLEGMQTDGVILPSTVAALQKQIIEEKIPVLPPPPKIDFAALLEPEVEISPTDQAVHESGNKSSIGPEEPNEDAANEPAADGTANTAASVVAAEPTDVVGTSDQTADAESLASEKMANEVSVGGLVIPVQQRKSPQVQITSMLEKVALSSMAKRTYLFSTADTFTFGGRTGTAHAQPGQSRGKSRDDPVKALWNNLSDENKLPFMTNMIQPSQAEMAALQLGLNSGGLAGALESTKVNWTKASECLYSFTDRSIHEYLVARRLLQSISSAANETIDDIIVRLGLHTVLNPPKDQGAHLQQARNKAMAEADAKRQAQRNEKEAAATLSQALFDRKASEDSFGNSSERRINPVWLSDGFFRRTVELIADIPGADELLFPDNKGHLEEGHFWKGSPLIKSFGPTFSLELATAMQQLKKPQLDERRRPKGAKSARDGTKVALPEDEVDKHSFEHRAYRSSHLFGPYALGLLVRLGANRLVTVDCSGSTELTGRIDPFEQCLSLQYLSLESCRGIYGASYSSCERCLCVFSYLRVVSCFYNSRINDYFQFGASLSAAVL